jgi:hypothetical protein
LEPVRFEVPPAIRDTVWPLIRGNDAGLEVYLFPIDVTICSVH